MVKIKSDNTYFSASCAIPDTRDETLYITGRAYSDFNKVQQYGPEGFIADLPDLITGRSNHACAGYYDDQDHFVLLVAVQWGLRDKVGQIYLTCEDSGQRTEE